MSLLNKFKTWIDIEKMPENPIPPKTLLPFYWYFVRQIKAPLFLLLFFNFIAVIVDVSIPYAFGRIVDMVTLEGEPIQILLDNKNFLIFFIALIVIGRIFAWVMYAFFYDRVIFPRFANLIRNQCHIHILKQSWSFFQNDFSGRIASKVMEMGPAIRDTTMSLASSIWYVGLFAIVTAIAVSAIHWMFIAPIAIWFLIFGLMTAHYTKRIQGYSRKGADSKSVAVGRVVDSYTNIQTVKLFSRNSSEKEYVLEALHENVDDFMKHHGIVFRMQVLLWSSNSIALAVITVIALHLWSIGEITAGNIAMILPLILQVGNMAGWMMTEIRLVYERIGIIEDGLETISKDLTITDKKNAKDLVVSKGDIAFDNIKFHYGKESGVIENLSLKIPSGQKIGVVGRSGAGKSTIVNLLLRFYELESGSISIDNQNISQITQDSLRSNIAVVTQDTSLMHRSIRDNITYGKPDATDEEMIEAAKKAGAHEFILELEDMEGSTGYDAQVGERGVKLSGGQRQRVAIARVILKDAPILILDEATSALDSEIEAVIQEKLYELMQGKTVIAIAHRLSTISAMDRLIILDKGNIVEDGTHKELVKARGAYAKLWNMQSGGFLGE